MTNRIAVAQDRLEVVHRRYDGDHDTMPGMPPVTWADEQLADVIEPLIEEIESLLHRVAELEERASGHSAPYGR